MSGDARPAPPWAHPLAEVEPGAVLGAGTRVWRFSHVAAGARIGADCVLGQNVAVGPGVTIGDRCKVQNNVSLYAGVVLEDGVFCGPSCVFTNVTTPRAEIDRKAEFKVTRVRRGATIGANATIVCGVTIGAYAFIGAGAVVKHDVPDFALMAGVPARQVGWISRFAERLPLRLTGKGEATCPHTGEVYLLTDGVCSLLPSHTQL